MIEITPNLPHLSLSQHDVVSYDPRPPAVLVQVKSRNDSKQHMSVILQNGFLKLVVSLDSYNTERVRVTWFMYRSCFGLYVESYNM